MSRRKNLPAKIFPSTRPLTIKDLNVELRAREKNRKAEYKKLKEETDNENRELKRAQSAALTAQTTALLAISDKLMKQEKG